MVRHPNGKPNLTDFQHGDDHAVLNMIDEGGPVHSAREEQDTEFQRENGFGEEELRNITYQ